MLVHNVFFWLRDDIDEARRQAFGTGLESLRGIPVVREMFVGVPADSPSRPVLVTDYDFALTVIMEDMGAHDVYQEHPLHLAFLREFQGYWSRVQIYDAV
jgi:hypothetical protein